MYRLYQNKDGMSCLEIKGNNFTDSEELVKCHDLPHILKGIWPINSLVALQSVCHYCVPVTRENVISPRVSPHLLLTGEMSCGSCTLSSLLWHLSEIQTVRRQLLPLDQWLFYSFFLILVFIANMHPVKRPIMCRSILGKTEDCLEYAEEEQQLFTFLGVLVHVHVEKGRKCE